MSRGRPGLHDAALAHDGDFVGQRQGLTLVVGDIDRGEAEIALHTLEFKAHRLAQLGIEVRQRLVEQQKLRLHDQCAGERQALLLAAGQLGGVASDIVRELYGREHPHHLFLNLLAARPLFADLERKRGILVDVHVRPNRVGLKHHPEIAPVRRNENSFCGGKYHAATGIDRSGFRALQPGDRTERGGLAATARAKERKQLAIRHVE